MNDPILVGVGAAALLILIVALVVAARRRRASPHGGVLLIIILVRRARPDQPREPDPEYGNPAPRPDMSGDTGPDT